jgi:arabinan endo-1,5-alpha-L-arabinosidase
MKPKEDIVERSYLRRKKSTLGILALLLALLASSVSVAGAQPQAPDANTYTNPLPIAIPDDGMVESCADPSLIRGQQPGDNYWYMYCTKDPLNDEDRNAGGGFTFHNIPMLKSLDLVNWVYTGDAFATPPAWGEPTSGIWAPEIQYFNNQYYLYYVMTDTKPEVSGEPGCGGDSAIGVAISASPTGPWNDHGSPVVAPRRGGPGCNFFWTFDPEVLTAGSQRYLYYGSYYGGIHVRPLSDDGFTTDPGAAVQVAIPNRYEGAEVIRRDGYFYMFVSAGNCCNGAVTGYSVFVGRSADPTGPFVDREGVSFLDARVGGTPSITQNGNRWIGTGHNSIFRDFSGQWWTVYHAVDRNDPVFAGTTDFTKRPVLMDRLDWINGWPILRAGLGPSDTPQPAPAAQPGDRSRFRDRPPEPLQLGKRIRVLSDEFNGQSFSAGWTWVRQPDPATYGLTGTAFRFDTQAADLFEGNNSASVLTEPAPAGDYVVETRVKLNLPPEGCCFNYVQAGVLIYGGDDNYVRLMHVSIWETRQTEFAKEFFDPFRGNVHFGGTLVGPPAEWTYLRILKRTVNGEEHYTPYTSRDGETWVRGGTWTHSLGASARIGLGSMGGGGFVAEFDYVRVYEYKEGW